jgi:hypothetical protein
MNRIKGSFSEIKASDKFKDKLERELHNNPVKLKAVEHTRKPYNKLSIAAAATALILFGGIGIKLTTNTLGSSASNDTTYSSTEEPNDNKEYAMEDSQNNKNNNTATNNTKTESNDISKPISQSNEKEVVHKSEKPSKNVNESTSTTSKTSNDVIGSPRKESAMPKDNTPPTSTENKEYAMEVAQNNNNNTETKSTDISSTSSNTNEKEVLPKGEENLTNVNESAYTTSDVSNDIVGSPREESTLQKNSTTATISASDESNNVTADTQSLLVNSVTVPKFNLPSTTTNGLTARMMPLIMYKGKVYIYTSIEIDSKSASALIGKKLGTTKGSINEWSNQSDYSTEFASNIGVTDVYSVNGYDENFRIMTNITTEDGKSFPEFYDCINGINIKNGEDVFGKLNLKGNIVNAKFQTFSDWNNSTGTFYSITDSNLLNSLVEELYKATPYLPEDIEDSLGDYRNDDQYRELYLDLKDGSKNINITILKSGYVYYGNPKIYFKLDSKFAETLWDNLGVMHIFN